MGSWSQPCCETCWREEPPDLPVGVLPANDDPTRLPVRLTHAEAEICAWCGLPTVSGIYVRRHPKSVVYPVGEDS